MFSTSIFTLVFIICLQTILLSTFTNCAKTISMYWNTTNSIFRIDNTDHIIDVNKNNAAFEYDQVNIICPVYQPGTYDDEAEKYIIYNVSKEEYETCRITNPSPRVIAICDKPFKTMYFTITFRPFTPQPGGLEFHPGRDYYFISTSSRDDLHRRIGGRCTTHNMKVVFKVCCNEAEQPTDISTRNNSSAVTSSTVSSSISSTSTVHESINGANIPSVPLPPSVYKGTSDRFYPANSNGRDDEQLQPVDNVVVSPTLSHAPVFPNQPQQSQPPVYQGPLVPQSPKTSITQKKKNKEYSDHPNEVVKNEELTYNGASSRVLFGHQKKFRHKLAWKLVLLSTGLLPYLLR